MSAGKNYINYISNSTSVFEAAKIRSPRARAQTELPNLSHNLQFRQEELQEVPVAQLAAGATLSQPQRLPWVTAGSAGSHHNCILSGQSQHRMWSRSEYANICTRLNIKYADICSQAICIVLDDLEFIIYRSYSKESELFELMHTCSQSERTIRISNFISLSFSV